jgi:hypothetical protein
VHNNPVNNVDPLGFGISATLAGICVNTRIGAHFIGLFPFPLGVENASINGVIAAAEAYTSSTATGIPVWFPSLYVMAAEAGISLAFFLVDNLALRPDLVRLDTGGIFEINPVNKRQISKGSVQLARYVLLMRTAWTEFAALAAKWPTLAALATLHWPKGYSVEYTPPGGIQLPWLSGIIVTIRSGIDLTIEQGLVLYNAQALIKFDLKIEYLSLMATLATMMFGGITAWGAGESAGLGAGATEMSLATNMRAATAAVAAASKNPATWLLAA